MATVSSPFATSGTAQRLPARKVASPAKITIRVDDAGADTDRVHILVHPNELASAVKADLFLYAGESVSYEGEAVRDQEEISIIATSGTPSVFFGVT
jgi:hypothetical protein